MPEAARHRRLERVLPIENRSPLGVSILEAFVFQGPAEARYIKDHLLAAGSKQKRRPARSAGLQKRTRRSSLALIEATCRVTSQTWESSCTRAWSTFAQSCTVSTHREGGAANVLARLVRDRLGALSCRPVYVLLLLGKYMMPWKLFPFCGQTSYSLCVESLPHGSACLSGKSGRNDPQCMPATSAPTSQHARSLSWRTGRENVQVEMRRQFRKAAQARGLTAVPNSTTFCLPRFRNAFRIIGYFLKLTLLLPKNSFL